MIWINLLTVLIALVTGYLLGTRRDRNSTILSKQIECVERLHERVLEIEKNELSDGTRQTLAIRVMGSTETRTDPLSNSEVEYLSRLEEWRQQLLEEENRARLWISNHTVRGVSNYFLLMMQCKSWKEFGQGNLIEDPSFLSYLQSIFGSKRRVLKKVVRIHGDTGEPWLLDCVKLSDMCLDAIQRRIRLEISAPLFFRVLSLWWNLQERLVHRIRLMFAPVRPRR